MPPIFSQPLDELDEQNLDIKAVLPLPDSQLAAASPHYAPTATPARYLALWFPLPLAPLESEPVLDSLSLAHYSGVQNRSLSLAP
jgi:hypothetical protein